MVPDAAFASGMAALAVNFNREQTAELTRLYFGVVGEQLTAEQWEHAVRQAIERETYFPPAAILLRYGRAREQGALTARAAEAYEAVCELFVDSEGVDARQVLERFGRAARDGYVAAGGHVSFAWIEPESRPFHRKAFIEAFCEVAEGDPVASLPAARMMGALGSGAQAPAKVAP